MVLFNNTGLATTLFINYSNNVFGSPTITAIMLLLIILIITLLIKIPLSIGLSLLIPLSLVMMAIGWLPIIAGAIIIIILMVLAGVTMASSLF